MDYDEIMKVRYKATPAPQPTGDAGKDQERIVQWLLEVAFFRDFIYRNPEGKKKGKELSDASIIYDDTVIVVQVKTHDSSKPVEEWIKKELPQALKQLKGSHRLIKERIVIRFENEVLNTKIEVDPDKHKWIYGIIILACESKQLDPLQYIDKKDLPDFAYLIFSTRDFETILRRMDTPGDFLSYYDLRFNAKDTFTPLIQDEENTMEKIIPLLPDLLGTHFKEYELEKQMKTLDLFSLKLTKDAIERSDYGFSMLIDDIISRAHDIDKKLYAVDEKGHIETQRIAEFFGCLDRGRRIALGKLMYANAEKATDGKDHYFSHCQKAADRTFVYLFTSNNRKARTRFLFGLVAAAQKKYGLPRVLGIATEPLGKGGRSYDFVLADKFLPDLVYEKLEEIGDLFGNNEQELL